jgi:hypothetical protein
MSSWLALPKTLRLASASFCLAQIRVWTVEIPQSKFFTGGTMKSFIVSLFDFKFDTFITKSVASVLYAITTVLVALGTVIVMILAIAEGFILLFPLAPIAGLLTLTILRVAYESSIALVTIAVNTKK